MGEIKYLYPHSSSLVFLEISGVAKDMTIDEIRDYIDEKLFREVNASLPSVRCYEVSRVDTPEGTMIQFECYAHFNMDNYIESKLRREIQ